VIRTKTIGRRALATGLLGLLAVGLGGCGLLPGSPARPAASARSSTAAQARTVAASGVTAPGARSARVRTASAAVAATRRTHELPTPAPTPHVSGGWRTPPAAVRAFAEVYVNWTAVTVAGRLRALAAASVGQARAELTTEAAEVAGDRELHAGQVTNSGVVEAVARLPGSPSGYAVVTRERTGALDSTAYRGLAAAWHVSLATVRRLPDGLWVLSGWQPEN
jgi:hypothetical protein